MGGFTVTRRGLAPDHSESVGVAQLPSSVATISSSGGAAASTPTVWLDSYYDSAVYANKSAAIQAAYAAAAAQRATLECQARRVYSLDTAALQLAPSLPIMIEGRGATFQANWGKPRCIDFTRTADYQTFQNIDIRDLIFDANNLTAASNQSVVGNLIDGGGVNMQRVNAQSVYLRRCQWKNVPVGTSIAYHCFSLWSRHLAGAETQTNLIDIRLERAVMRGGNYGADIIGACPTTTAVEVYHDKLYVDVDHDPGVVPAATHGGANCQIGGLGWGDNCEVRIIGANSSDVGLEIDGMQRADIYGRITDCWNAEFFARNFHAPPDANSQRYVYHACHARVVNLNPDPATGIVAAGFQIGHTSTPNPTFGEAVLEDCSFYSASANLRNNGNALFVMQNALVSRVTIVGTFTITYPSVNDAPGSTQTPTPVFILPASTTFVLSGGNILIVYAGTGGANLKPRSVALSPQAACTMRVDLGDISIASSLASVSAGNTRGLIVGLSGSGGGSISGRIRRLGWESFSGGDTTPQLYLPNGSGTITIDGRLIVDEVDLRKDPAASPTVVNVNGGIDTANKAKLPVRSANMPTYPIPSVAMSGTVFATTNFTTATGNQYIGSLPAEIQFATGTGAAVTAIDVSKDGTTYENVYTQASAALAQSVIVPVECGDFVKVTFATTQPTARIRFRRAQ